MPSLRRRSVWQLCGLEEKLTKFKVRCLAEILVIKVIRSGKWIFATKHDQFTGSCLSLEKYIEYPFCPLLLDAETIRSHVYRWPLRLPHGDCGESRTDFSDLRWEHDKGHFLLLAPFRAEQGAVEPLAEILCAEGFRRLTPSQP